MLWTLAKATDGEPMARREPVGCLEATFLGLTYGLDLAFFMMSSTKVDHPRVTSPLALSGLGSGFGLFSVFFFLVTHTIQIFTSTLSS